MSKKRSKVTVKDEKLNLSYELLANSIDAFQCFDVKNIPYNQLLKDDSGRNQLFYEFRGTISVVYEKNIIQHRVFVNVFATDKDDKNIRFDICSIATAFDFEVPDLNSFIEEKNLVRIPWRLNTTFTSIAYGTTRGMLYTKMQGASPVGQITMPMLNLLELKGKDIIYDMKNNKIQRDLS